MMNYLKNLDDTGLRRALTGESPPGLPVFSHPYFKPEDSPVSPGSTRTHHPHGILWRTREFLENAQASTQAKSALTFWSESYTPLPLASFEKLTKAYASHADFLADVEKVGEADGEGWRLAAVLGVAERSRWERWERALHHAIERESFNDGEEWAPKVVSLFFGCVACLLGLFPIVEGSHSTGGATDVESGGDAVDTQQTQQVRTPALECALTILRAVPPMEHWSDSYLSPTTQENKKALDKIISKIIIGAHSCAWARIAGSIGGGNDAQREKYRKIEEEVFTKVKDGLSEDWAGEKADEYMEMQEAQEKKERRLAKEAMKWQKLTATGVREAAKRDVQMTMPTEVAMQIAQRRAEELEKSLKED